MLELELVVVLVGLGSETYLLHLLTHLFLLQFLLATLLLIEELGIVDETTNRRLGIRRDLDQIDTLLPSEVQGFPRRHHFGAFVRHNTHFPNVNFLIHAVL